MELYLVQHGKAKSKEEEPVRSLTEQGRMEVSRVASFVANLKVEAIFHSGKWRAADTAEIFGEQLGLEPEEKDGLSPMDNPSIWVDRLKQMSRPIMLVGHLPHLGRLTSLLTCNDAGAQVVNFTNGGVVFLERVDYRWSIQWVLVPPMVPQLIL